ncbi:poly polymerase [Trichonephila clavipes]|nr:poly polymerase [Trichonephila clavipes]
MIPAYNKRRCAAFPFKTGIHFRRKSDFFPEEDTTKSYSGFEPEPTRLQAEGHSHHTAGRLVTLLIDIYASHSPPLCLVFYDVVLLYIVFMLFGVTKAH